MAAASRLPGGLRIPTLTGVQLPPAPHLSALEASTLLVDFLRKGKGKTLVVTGAGVSVDSGIRAYRGVNGSYTVNKTHRPIFYGEFVASEKARRRYWARSFLGYVPVREASPNPTHFSIAALQKMGLVQGLITQNVDGLHHKAWDSSLAGKPSWSTSNRPITAKASTSILDPPILELHGTLRHAHCLDCKTTVERNEFQDRLAKLNPEWQAYSDDKSVDQEQRLNPDGDVELGPGITEASFVVPPCDKCGGPMKPGVTFFGESLSPETRDRSLQMVAEASQLLVVGSSLATFSAFRLARQMNEAGRPIGIVNVGECRGDALAAWRIGLEEGSGAVLPPAVKTLLADERRQDIKDEVDTMLKSGKIKQVSAKHATT